MSLSDRDYMRRPSDGGGPETSQSMDNKTEAAVTRMLGNRRGLVIGFGIAILVLIALAFVVATFFK